MNISKSVLAIFLLSAFACAAVPLRGEEIVIKFATLAPEGSTWMQVMQEWNRELAERSGGRLKFRIYAGGVSGDEKDVVRKIRLGQLQAGGFTGVGLGETAPEVRILDAPFLFRDTGEVDFIYDKFRSVWEKAFQKGGYVLLGWAEVGFVYPFTSKPAQNLFQLKESKMWTWEGDPIAEAAFTALGVKPIPLSVADVMTSLQTGLIDAVYGSPLGVIALQWFTRTRYMLDVPLANASGAVLISKKAFDKLPADLQKILLETAKRHLDKITQLSRKENLAAIGTLKKNGVMILNAQSEKEAESYGAAGEKARRLLVGRLYPESLLQDVEGALAQYRAAKRK